MLKQANSAKSEFLSNMSHDMRTPMNAIISFSNLGMESDTREEALDCLSKINASGKYLMGLINDVLDMSKIEEGKLQLYPEPYAYADFENALKTILLPKAAEKGVELTFHCDAAPGLEVMFDKLRIQQIFVNLVGNAIKFTPKGGKVAFDLQEYPMENGKMPLKIIVRDNGIGMSEEFVTEKMYSEFAQEYSPSYESEGGTGLGLSIVKHLVDKMGASIECKSALGEGTEFTLWFYPDIVQAEDIRRKETPASVDTDLAGKRILLCEDHPLNVQIATRLLEKKGARVTCAENGLRGVELFRTGEPYYFDAILMDIRMPVMDGLEATREIRAMEREDAREIPILAMTANAFAEDMEKSKAAGMNAHLAKPIKPQRLYEVLAQCLQQRKWKS